MKKCTTCLIEKTETEFNMKNSLTGLLQQSCKLCTREQSKRYYRKNVLAHVNRASKSRINRTNKFKKFKEHLQCTNCNENDSSCLDFHHTDPTQKEFSISKMVGKTGTFKLITELEKCIILCSNCHKKFHAGRIQLSDSTEYMNKIVEIAKQLLK